MPGLAAVDHTLLRAFYVEDPDGHVVELGVDVPRGESAGLADPFAEDHPYRLP